MTGHRARGLAVNKQLAGLAIITLIVGILIALVLWSGPAGHSSEVERSRQELGLDEGRRDVPAVLPRPPGPPDSGRGLVADENE